MNRVSNILTLVLVPFVSTGISAQNKSQRAEISPLLKTEWGQQAPFYYKTPLINGEHAKTGCVATAMSQVIYYHQFPEQGKQGIFSFDNFSFDFSDTTFDYSAMKEKYDKSDDASDSSVVEVSNLMYACGVTVNMDYGVESSAGNFSLIPGALSEWFLYPIDGMGMLLKDYFTLDEWEDIVYDELAAGRPVLYMGGNGASSHVFVCDGYKEGKFHMNLGWYGEKNAYLPLSNLLTERVGKDGLWSMNSSQRIIRGVRVTGEKDPGPLATASSFSYDRASNTFSLSGISCFVNATSITPGIKLVNNDNSNEYFCWAASDAVINRGSSSISYTVELSGMEDGNYTIRPVYKLATQNNVYSVYCKIVNTRYYTADISSNTIINPVEGSDIVVDVTVSEYNPASTFIKGENYGYGFTLFAENNGNSTITWVGVNFCNPETSEEVRSTVFNESLAPGECKTISLTIPYTAGPGEYDMHIYDNNTKQEFCDPIRVIFHGAGEITSAEGSPFRYMPLAEDSDEAMILMPKTSTFAGDIDSEVEIESSVTLNGKIYKITEIGPRLLYGRKDITSLTIPSTVRKIDVSAFGGCTNISEITVNAASPPALHSTAFDRQVVSAAKLSVPEGSMDLYKEAPVWEDFSYDADTEGFNSIILESFTIAPGSDAGTSLYLKTMQQFSGCQFKMTMPKGLQLVSNGVTVSESLEGRNFVAACSALKDDNSYTVLMYSSDNTPYPTGNTPILNLSFTADTSFAGGTITISDVMLSKEDGDVYSDVDVDSSTCLVSMDSTTSIPGVEEWGNTYVDVYNVAGILMARHLLFETIKTSLSPGLYILRAGPRSKKVMVQ